MIPDASTEIQDQTKSKVRLICGEIEMVIGFIK